MIVCDREHLGLIDARGAAQRLRAPAGELRGRSRDRGNRPRAAARRLHPRAMDRESYGDDVEVLASVDGHPVAIRDGQRPGLLLSPGAHRRPADSRVADGDRDRGSDGSAPRIEPAADRRPKGREMIDPRVANLARILVGYSTKVVRGRDLRDRGLDQRPSRWSPPSTRRSCARAANPVVRLSFDGQVATYYREASDAQLEWVSPLSKWAAEECRLPDRDRRRHQHARSSPGSRPSARRMRQAATRELMKRMMERAAEGTASLGLHALSDQRLRLGRRDEPARLRGLLLPRLPRRR